MTGRRGVAGSESGDTGLVQESFWRRGSLSSRELLLLVFRNGWLTPRLIWMGRIEAAACATP